MNLLQWSWTLRFGPYARATFASHPVLGVLPVLLAAFAALVFSDDGVLPAAVAAVLAALVLVALLLLTTARSLRRLQNATLAAHQQYTLTPDVLEIALGQDRYSVPLSQLAVARRGRDWVSLRRRAMGGRRMLLFFDDPALAARAAAIIAERGAGLSPDPPISTGCAPSCGHAGCVADPQHPPGMPSRRRLPIAPAWRRSGRRPSVDPG